MAEIAAKFDPGIAAIKTRFKDVEEKLMSIRLFDDDVSSTGGSSTSDLGSWRPGYVRVGMSPFGENRAMEGPEVERMLAHIHQEMPARLKQVVDFDLARRKMVRGGAVHTIIAGRADAKYGPLMNEAAVTVQACLEKTTAWKHVVVKAEIHPHRRLRVRCIYAAKDVVDALLGIENATLQWQPKADILANDVLVAIMSNVGTISSWKADFLQRCGKALHEVETLHKLTSAGRSENCLGEAYSDIESQTCLTVPLWSKQNNSSQTCHIQYTGHNHSKHMYEAQR